MARLRAADTMVVPMAPMIDVVFQLLIYFVLTFREEIPEAHLAVNLPAPSKAPASKVKPKLLELTVRAGEVELQGVPRTTEMIKDTLTYLAKLDAEQTVIVKVSVTAPLAELVQVLDLCTGAGLTKLNVVTLRD